MDAITLYKDRERIIRTILDADEDTIAKVVEVLKNAVQKKKPAVMTVDELKTEVMQSVDDAKNGLGITQDEFFKEMDEW
ncbi:hypothetical protein D0T84_21330 [Dysgonomonas sp. 521]|uniref:hypothetical protein n=1 Tax=Dysgonomonas sp. 521 TaxID=2302932 RepID=UPI0013D40950|nr:hypothetical protein [Dysgonomonas sp. 521]NDV97419.1 hypothetical protein [Dysgonomonas sp. 521]